MSSAVTPTAGHWLDATTNIMALAVIAMGVLIVVAMRMFDIIVYPLIIAMVIAGLIMVALVFIMYFMGLLKDEGTDEDESAVQLSEQELEQERSQLQRTRIVVSILSIMLMVYAGYHALTVTSAEPPKYDEIDAES